MAKQVIFGKETIQKIKVGIDIACDAIKSTIGPKGRNAFIDNEMQPKITNDGVTIAHAITLEDKFENLGAWLVKNTSSQTNDDAGDGTSTTSVLLQSIIDESLKRPESPMDIKKSLAIAGVKVEKWIKESSRIVKEDEIEAVATISAESKEIGKLIAEIIKKVGKNVPITLEDNKFADIEYEVTEGLETKVGYESPKFITNTQEGVAQMDDVYVFATDRRISNIVELSALLTLCQQKKISTMVMLCSEMEKSVVSTFILNKDQGMFSALIIRVRGYEIEDMAAASGATLISEQTGLKLSDIKEEHLGKVKRIVASDKKTLIISNENVLKTEAIKILRAKSAATKNIYEAQHLNKRADQLEGGVAVIKVGAHTDSEREYLKYKIEDAVNAAKSAIDEGLVEGGGICLYRISNKLKGKFVGEVILRKALKAPLRAIIENCGEDYTSVVKRITNKKGYDASNNSIVDMFKKGIVDPTKVTRCAFVNSLSTASTFITSAVAITDKPEIKK